MRRSAIAALVILVPCVAAGCASAPPLSGTSPAATGDLTIRGHGAPAIVLQSNIGDDQSVWSPLLDSLATLSTTVAYDRDGYGKASATLSLSPEDHTVSAVATRLRERLRQARIPPPYLLVAQAAGALYAMQFAALYDGDVAGLVLIDAPPPDFGEACRLSGLSPCRFPTVLLAAVPPPVRVELLGLEASEGALPRPDQLRDVPVTLITSDDPPSLLPPGGLELWQALQKRFMDALPRGRTVHAAGSSARIQRDRPDVVVAEVRRMLRSLSRPAGSPHSHSGRPTCGS